MKVIRNIFLVLLLVVVIYLLTGCGPKKEYSEKQTRDDIDNLVIDVPESRQDGVLDIYDPDGVQYLHYYGKIHIDNDGTNGQAIKVTVYMNESEEYEFN